MFIFIISGLQPQIQKKTLFWVELTSGRMCLRKTLSMPPTLQPKDLTNLQSITTNKIIN